MALRDAIAEHRAGRMTAAETAYRSLIQAQPHDAGINHHLGVLLVQTGRADEGLNYLRAALEANGAEPLYYFSLAKGLLAAGNPAEAGTVLRQAGQVGVADKRFEPLKAQIRDAAVAQYRQALAARPGDAVLLDNLGTALLAQGKVEDAIACYREALTHQPDFAEAHFHLGAFGNGSRMKFLANLGLKQAALPPHERPHIPTLTDLPADALPGYFALVQRVAAAVESGTGADGTFVAMNNKISQSVPHLHTHVVPRRRKDGLRGFFWPRTKYGSETEAAVLAAAITAALPSSLPSSRPS